MGIAIGAGGSEAAIEAADIALTDGSLEGLVRVRQLGRRMMRTIDQNFWAAMAAHAGGTALGLWGPLTPAAAGLLHIGEAVVILGNALRLLR